MTRYRISPQIREMLLLDRARGRVEPELTKVNFDHEHHIYFCDVLEHSPSYGVLKLKIFMPDGSEVIGWQSCVVIDLYNYYCRDGELKDGRFNSVKRKED